MRQSMMRWVAPVALWLFSAGVVVSAQEIPTHWGTEFWYCGTKSWFATLGDGTKPVLIYRVDVSVTATPPNGVGNFAANLQRQGLVYLSYLPVSAWASSTQPPGNGVSDNNEVDAGAWALNPKTIGLNPVVLNQTFDFSKRPLFVVGTPNHLQLRVTSGPDTTPIFAGDCLDIEIHQTIVWSYGGPDGL